MEEQTTELKNKKYIDKLNRIKEAFVTAKDFMSLVEDDPNIERVFDGTLKNNNIDIYTRDYKLNIFTINLTLERFDKGEFNKNTSNINKEIEINIKKYCYLLNNACHALYKIIISTIHYRKFEDGFPFIIKGIALIDDIRRTINYSSYSESEKEELIDKGVSFEE